MASGVVYYRGSSFQNLRDHIDELGDDVCKIADTMVGDFGSEARRALGPKFEARVHMGKYQTKWKSSKRKKGYVGGVFSRMDAGHGWYVGSKGTRLIGFNYENVAYQKGGKKGLRRKLRPISYGYVQSIIANLFAQPIYYPKGSPWFHREGEERKARWYKGFTRDTYINNFNAESVGDAVSPAIAKTERKIDGMLTARGFWK